MCMLYTSGDFMQLYAVCKLEKKVKGSQIGVTSSEPGLIYRPTMCNVFRSQS